MKARKAILVGLLSFVVLACASLYVWKQSPSGKAPIAAGAQSDRITVPTPEHTLVRGQQIEYELRYSGEIPDSAGVKRFEIDGTLFLTTIDDLKESYRVALQFKPDRVVGLDAFSEEYRSAWKNAITSVVPAELSRRGFVLEISKQADIGPMAKEFWAGLAEKFHVQLPETLKPKFQQEETDGGHLILAEYTLDPTVNLKDLAQQRLYIQKSFQTREGSDPMIEGEIVAIMREGMQGIDQLENKSHLTLKAKGLNLSAASAIKVRWIRSEKISDEELARLETAEARDGDFAIENAVQKEALGVLTLPDIWGRIEALGNDAVVPQELYLQLKAWIFLHPKELDQLRDKMRHLKADDNRLRNVIKALTAVGSVEAQALMVDLLKDNLKEPELAKRLATSLGFVKEPSVPSQATLKEIIGMKEHPEVAAQAALAIGIMGRNLHRNGEEIRALEIETMAKQMLESAKSNAEILSALAMLGNSGPSERGVIAKYLASEDPEVRAQANFALRFAHEADTPQVLARNFQAEPAGAARKSILQAMTLREADGPWFDAIEVMTKEGRLSNEEQLALAYALANKAKKDPQKSMTLLGAIEKGAGDADTRAQVGRYKDQAARVTAF